MSDPRAPFKHRAPDYVAVGSDPAAREQQRSAVARVEERLEALRHKLTREKRRLREASAREQGIREGVLGRVVWKLVDNGSLEPAVVDLIRAELRACVSPAQAAAFLETVLDQR
jgi:hypothetical protein